MHPTLARLCTGDTARQNGPERQPTVAGNGGTFLAKQCEDLRALSVEMDEALGATPEMHHSANSLGFK